MEVSLAQLMGALSYRPRTEEEIKAYTVGRRAGSENCKRFTGLVQNLQEAYDDGYDKGKGYRDYGDDEFSPEDDEILQWYEEAEKEQ